MPYMVLALNSSGNYERIGRASYLNERDAIDYANTLELDCKPLVAKVKYIGANVSPVNDLGTMPKRVADRIALGWRRRTIRTGHSQETAWEPPPIDTGP